MKNENLKETLEIYWKTYFYVDKKLCKFKNISFLFEKSSEEFPTNFRGGKF